MIDLGYRILLILKNQKFDTNFVNVKLDFEEDFFKKIERNLILNFSKFFFFYWPKKGKQLWCLQLAHS